MPRHAQQSQVHLLNQIRHIHDRVAQPHCQIALQALAVVCDESRYESLSIIGWQAKPASELPLLY